MSARTVAVSLLAALAPVLAAGVAAGSRVSARRHINLANRPIAAPFSDAVQAGGTLWISGRLGLDATGKPPADPAEEARLALDGIRAVLAEAGLAMDHLVSVTVYCPDVSLYATFNEVYRGYFTREFPARAFVGSGPLLRGARFEIHAVAVR